MNEPADKPFSNQHESRTAKRIQDALDGMHSRRKEFQDRRAMGDVEERDKLVFAASLLWVFDELRPFRGDVRGRWGDPDHVEFPLDELPEKVGMVQRERVVSRGYRDTIETQMVVPTPAATILAVSYELDDLAHELGFEPGVEAGDRLVDDDDIVQV